MKKKRLGLLIGSTISLILIIAGVCAMWYTSSEFRYNFDVIFNCDDTHYSYSVLEDGTNVIKTSLPLPDSTTMAFRHSDSAATYYSKLNYEAFLEYYIEEGYVVQGNIVFTDDGAFAINDVNENLDETWKYTFVDISLVEQ